MRCFCRVEYDGTRYAGWQVQVGHESVQSVIERALTTVLRCKITIVGAGRTDAGVHGRGQGMHFDCSDSVNIDKLLYAVNSIMPRDVSLYNMRTVPDDFHARYSAIERRYRYHLSLRKMPLMLNRTYQVTYPLDWDRMELEAKSLLGTHDFRAFCASRTSTINMVCTVTQAFFERHDDNVVFQISADRFIYKMVRSVVGTLLDIGRGALNVPIVDILAGKNRLGAGETAPPTGLVLEWVSYREVD